MDMFKGLSAFPITPVNARGEIDGDALAGLLDRLVAARADAVGLLGSTGTYMYLSRDQRRRAVEIAVSTLGEKLPLIVGVGALRTDEAVGLAKDAARASANGLLLAPVSYTPLNDEEIRQHFTAVAEASDLPLCIYNNPATTHFSFSTDLLAKLAEHPNIKAVKMPLPSSGTISENLTSLRAALPADFSIGYSGDWGCCEALSVGADCWYSVIGGTLPELSKSMAQAAMAGDLETAEAIDARFSGLWNLFKTHGSLRVVYAIANLLNLTTAQPPRPIMPLTDEAMASLRKELSRLNLAR